MENLSYSRFFKDPISSCWLLTTLDISFKRFHWPMHDINYFHATSTRLYQISFIKNGYPISYLKNLRAMDQGMASSQYDSVWAQANQFEWVHLARATQSYIWQLTLGYLYIWMRVPYDFPISCLGVIKMVQPNSNPTWLLGVCSDRDPIKPT